MNAFDIAWSLLKADPAAQMVDSMGRRTGMGTIPDAVMGMLASRGLSTSDVSLPMENLRDVRQRFGDESRFVPEVHHEDHGMGDIATPTTDQEFFDTGQALASEGRVTPAHFKGGEVTPGPEEGFLTPSQAFASDPALAANLRRNVGGQQMGERMRGLRHQTGGQTGVARGATLRNRNMAVEPEAPAPKLSPEQQLQQRLQAMAESSGMDFKPTIDMTPQNTTPMEIPMEIQNKIRDVPNYGMNEAAAELGVDPAELRRGMKALPGFRSGPSARKLEYDRQASTPPEYELQTAAGKPTAPGASSGYMIPTGPYGDVQREIGTMGPQLGPESMYSQLMGMEGGLSPEANAAVLARLGLSPTDIDLADHDMRAAEARSPTSDLRSMRGGSDQGERNLTAEDAAAINMGRGGKQRTRPTAANRHLYSEGTTDVNKPGQANDLTEEELAAASARADEKLGRNKTRL